MNRLQELEIVDNTLVDAMADYAPTPQNPTRRLGMTATIFRGGKSGFLDGAFESQNLHGGQG